MLGVIIYDSSQKLPIYWSPRMTREFVDGVLDVVSADRSSQISYAVGPPSMYRGSVQSGTASSSSAAAESTPSDGGFFNSSNNGNQSSDQQQQQQQQNKVSNYLLHASLLSGVVESHHKIAQQHNSSAETGLIRPPHWPRLVRTGGTALGRAALAPTCPLVSRAVPAPAPFALTKSQVNSSKALNEGCVALSSNSPHSWLHPSVAPCSTEPIADWILSHEPKHQQNQDELRRERVSALLGAGGAKNQVQQDHVQNRFSDPLRRVDEVARSEGGVERNPIEKFLPSMFYFPWRVFGDGSIGVVYCIFAPSPNVVARTRRVEVVPSTSSSSGSPVKNSFFARQGSNNDLVGVGYHHNANQLTNESFAGFVSSSRGNVRNTSSCSPNKQHEQQQQPNATTATRTINNVPLDSDDSWFHHEENLPAVKQSMANLFVLLCDAFKTTKSVEAPTSKVLISNLDQVHECVEICVPGNGRCIPLFDTPMARKMWKMRNEQ